MTFFYQLFTALNDLECAADMPLTHPTVFLLSSVCSCVNYAYDFCCGHRLWFVISYEVCYFVFVLFPCGIIVVSVVR